MKMIGRQQFASISGKRTGAENRGQRIFPFCSALISKKKNNNNCVHSTRTRRNSTGSKECWFSISKSDFS